MPRHFYWCAFIVAGLLLVAGWLAARDPLAVHRYQARQVGRVAQVVTHLDSKCANCHGSATNAPAKSYPAAALHQFGQPGYSSLTPTEVLSVVPSQVDIDLELIDLGEHILALAEHEDEHTNDAAQAYLQLYDETRSITTMSDGQLRHTLHCVAEVQDFLKVANNQASPVKWHPTDVQRQTSQTNASISAPLSTIVDMPHPGTLIRVNVVLSRTLMGANQFNIPLEVIYSVRRRGPPAGMYLDFGQNRRLLSSDMQSPFILSYRSGREREQWHV